MAKEEWDQGVYAMNCDDYATAAACFRRAIKIAGVGGEPFRSFKVCYDTGLALLCKAVREVEDDDDGGNGCLRSITALPRILNVNSGQDESDLDLAHKMFNAAWVIAQKDPDNTMDKVNVLRALGRVSGMKGDFDTAFKHTRQALSISEPLFESEPDDDEVRVRINMSLGYLQCWRSKFQEGSKYFDYAVSLLQEHLQLQAKRLQLQEQRLERDGEMQWRRLVRLEREAEKQWLLEHPDPWSDDEELDILSDAGRDAEELSCEEDAHILSEAHRDAAFSDMLRLTNSIPLIEEKLKNIRQLVSNSKSCADAMSSSRLDPPTASTAHTSRPSTIGKGVKRPSSDTALGEPSMKIPTLNM